ncbi:MAG TPA: hypothetical protein VFG76_05755, partial [Candidatus Polarisedimenticolia bacterium]|nr:hypothetical protein [Candidatus Polarisedimenticolia bacterium]
KDLVTGRLVSDVTLKDPWGRSFGFLSTSSGYKIIAYDAGGAENPGRSVARGVVAESREGSVPAGDAGKRTASGRSATAQ